MKTIFLRYTKPFLLSTSVGIIMTIICVLTTWASSVIEYPIMSWIYSIDIFAFFYPVFCSIPYCWLMYYEKKNKYHFFVYSRMKLKKYYFFHWCSGSLFAFMSLFFISISGALLSLCIKPMYQGELDIAHEYLFGTFLANMPLIYAVGISIWRGLIGTIMFTLGYVLSHYSKHIFIILTGPLIYSIIENFCTSILGISNMSLVSSFYPESINWNYFSMSPYVSIVIGPIFLIIICCIMNLYFYIKGKKNDS